MIHQIIVCVHNIIRGDIMNSFELTASITALANVIAKNLSINEVSLLGSIFLQFGDTLTTIALQRTLCEKNSDKSD